MLSVCSNAGNFSGYKRFSNKQNGSSNPSFGRALTSDERKISNILLERALQINGVNLNAMILPGAAIPAYHMKDKNGGDLFVDTGVGSPFSKAAQEHILFSKDLMGVNTIQQLPMGGVSPKSKENPRDISPFSGSPFEKGTHLIDPGKMYEMGLVDVEDIKKYNVPEDKRNDYRNDYDNYFEKNREFFNKAHENFKKKISEDKNLKNEYKEFLKRESEWVDKKATTFALVENIYANPNFVKWDKIKGKTNQNCKLEINGELDKKIFHLLNNPSDARYGEAKKRLGQIRKDSAMKESMRFYKFTQFVANKQANEHYKFMQDNGIKNIADVPIGETILDVHAFPDAFMLDFDAKKSRGMSTLICPMGDDKVEDWGLPALKPVLTSDNNLTASKDSKDFVGIKYGKGFEHSDTVRVDGAWQYKKQYVRHIYDDKSYDEWMDFDNGIFETIKNAFKKAGKEHEVANIVAENIGGGDRITKTNDALASLGMPQIEKFNPDCGTDKWATPGIHDDATLIENIKDRHQRSDYIARFLQGPRGDKGARKLQIMFQDSFGRDERYNDPNDKTAPSWTLRQPEKFEEFYYKQLAGENAAKQEFGINYHKVIKRAMGDNFKNLILHKDGKIVNNSGIKDAPIVAELMEHFETVLEEKGVYTTAAANEKQNDFMKGLHNKFGEKAVNLLIGGYDKLANKKLENKDKEYEKLMLEVEQAVNEHKAKNPPKPQNVNSDNKVPAPSPSGDSKGSKVIDDALDNKPVSKLSKTNKILLAVGLGVAALGGGIALYKKSLDKDKAKHKKSVVKIQEKSPAPVPPKVFEPVKQKNTVTPQKTNAKMQDKNVVVTHKNTKKSPQTHASNKNRDRNINLSA